MPQIRPYDKGLIHSMRDAVEIQDAQAIYAYVRCHYGILRPRDGELTQRYVGLDARTGWTNWLVMLRGHPLL